MKHALLLFLAGCASVVAEPVVVGRVGSLEVTADDVRPALATLGSGERDALAKDPALLNQLVRSVLVQRLVVKEAQDKGFATRPDVLAKLDRVREATLSEAYLQSVAAPPDDYPSDAELSAAYETNKAALLVPKSWRLAQIFIASTDGKPPKELDAVKKALKPASADFAALAATHSQEKESAARGGEIGWLTEAQVQPELRPHLAKLALGAVSEPLRLADGWHFLKVLDIREATTPTLDQVRLRLVQQLRNDRTRANIDAWLAKLVEQNPVAINELNLTQVLTDASR